jgi:hypothetical protein
MPSKFTAEAKREKRTASGAKHALGGFLFFRKNDLS